MAADPRLLSALAKFNASAAGAPAEQRPALQGAIGAVNSGPLGANGVPAQLVLSNGTAVPFNPLKEAAFQALGNAYSMGYLLVAVCTVVAALVAFLFIRGRSHDNLITPESTTQPSNHRYGKYPQAWATPTVGSQ